MLNKKLFRDIKGNLSQFFTIFLMVLIGVMAYSGIKAYMYGMEYTRDKFYSENNIKDLDVVGSNFTESDLDKVKSFDNVKDAERKLSINVSRGDDTLNLNFIESNNISKMYIIDGDKFDADKSGVWLDNYYAEANNLVVGDEVELNYDNYTFTEKIIGLINSPDHLYDVKDESQLMPNREEYGFAYISIKEIEPYIYNKIKSEKNITDKQLENLNINYMDYVVFNYLMVDVDDVSDINSVKSNIQNNIDNVVAVLKTEDTASDTKYQGEIDEGKTYVGVFSGLFIVIALLSVVTTMTRIVSKQKVQIGTLKALGFKNRTILKHYINYGFYVSLVGSICGLLLGYFALGKTFIGLEMAFFELPNGAPKMDNSSYVIALLVVACVCLFTYMTVRKYLKKSAAESLRNDIPNVKTRSLNITTKGIFKKMGFSTKWNIRDILRNKLRSITGIVGIASCTMLLVCAFGMLNSMKYFVKLQFHDIYNFNYKLSVKSDISDDDRSNLISKYGDDTSLSVLIETKVDNEIESNNIFVYDAGDKIRFMDNKGKFKELNSDEGVFITYKLASNLNKKIGDEIEWHILGSDTYYKSKIIGFNKDPQNQNISMTRKYYESLGLTYNFDSLYTNDNLNLNDNINGVDVISDIEKLETNMNKMLSMMMTMVSLISVIAVVLGIIIIYNTSILSYTEKQYQFSTLKVLGFKDNKIKNIFTEQNVIITLIAVIIGLPSGYYLTDWLFKTAIEESYDFGAHINISTYIIGALGTFVVTIIVSKILSKKISNIDMVSSLKANE